MMIALRADHDIDDGRAADDLAAFGLRDAARHRDPHLAPVARCFVLGSAQASELRIDFLGRLLADVTGVEDHKIGVVGVCRLDESFRRERVHHALCIVDIHLTAV